MSPIPPIDRRETDAFRVVHGAADGQPGRYRDRLGEWQLFAGETPPTPAEAAALLGDAEGPPAVRGVYFKRLLRQVRQTPVEEASPVHLAGEVASERFTVRENGLRFELSFREGYSTGLFLDQRENRRRLLTGQVTDGFTLPAPGPEGPPALLNCFAYTGAFSVCAARAGLRTTSLDLSRKYLDWGRRNFELNGLDPLAHDFIYGDVFDWLKRLGKKSRTFDVIVLDPPTFSRSPAGDFRATTDYGRLVSLALPLLRPGGVLLASTNAARFPAEDFVAQLRAAVASAGRSVVQEFRAPQPADFPVTPEEPAYLKVVWTRVAGAA